MASTKPENTFIKSVHRHLVDTYAEKMCNPYRAGIPDVWYSGFKRDLWVEYKFLPRTPRGLILPNLSGQQKLWIERRKAEGRNVWVIVGMKEGGVVIKYYDQMEDGVKKYRVMSRKEIASMISLFCNSN